MGGFACLLCVFGWLRGAVLLVYCGVCVLGVCVSCEIIFCGFGFYLHGLIDFGLVCCEPGCFGYLRICCACGGVRFCFLLSLYYCLLLTAGCCFVGFVVLIVGCVIDLFIILMFRFWFALRFRLAVIYRLLCWVTGFGGSYCLCFDFNGFLVCLRVV